MFTKGKSRSYESIMREMPRSNKNSGGKKYISPRFKYRYKDFACDYCLHRNSCRFSKCPYILDNISELISDKAFISAVDNAEVCENRHKQTLIYLKMEVVICL